MTAPAPPDWTAANQRVLVAELARLRARLGGPDARTGTDPAAAREGLTAPAAIDVLVETFGLTPFERDVLLLAAGVELDASVAARCAEAAGRPDRPWATFGLALSALGDPHWSALTPVAPLRRWRLVELDERDGLASARLRVDERILHYLAGVGYRDARLQPLLRRVDPPRLMAEGQRRLAREIAAAVSARGGPLPVVQLTGDDPHGQEDVAARAAELLGAPLYAVAAADLPASAVDADALSTLWEREAALSGCALLVERSEAGAVDAVQRFVEPLGGVVLVAGRDPLDLRRPTLPFRVDRPDAPEQRRMWLEVLGPAAGRLNGVLDGVAGHYRLSARSISEAAGRVGALLEGGQADPGAWRAIVKGAASALDALAQRIEPRARWGELILPEAQLSTLRQIASHVRHRLRVYHEWGFASQSARGLGITALFCGESGTGKTMAAEVLAADLALELYRIDLSAVVSKYIGETEKNLRRVFDAAEESGAILLFDEADALFGKRSEVKDSHDRYANIEVSYLLQRMEAYRGLAILTTNQKAALDAAFQRRLRFVVPFPFPDEAQRRLIWRGVFPAATPLDGVDPAKLARLVASGGHIRNVAVGAAFLAAEEAASVGMRHLLRAARAEAAKREHPLTEAETRGWA